MGRRAQLLRRPGRHRSPIPAPCIPPLTPAEDDLVLYTAGDPLYRAMLAAIGGARHRVWLETYIFADDTVGRWFAEALAEKARQGLDVVYVVDAQRDGMNIYFINPNTRAIQKVTGMEFSTIQTFNQLIRD